MESDAHCHLDSMKLVLLHIWNKIENSYSNTLAYIFENIVCKMSATFWCVGTRSVRDQWVNPLFSLSISLVSKSNGNTGSLKRLSISNGMYDLHIWQFQFRSISSPLFSLFTYYWFTCSQIMSQPCRSFSLYFSCIILQLHIYWQALDPMYFSHMVLFLL